MTRAFRYLLLALLAIALLTVALANRALVTVHFLPDDMAALFGLTAAMDLPLFVLLFFGIVIGLLVGFVWEWLREHKHRRVANTKTREVSKLERELAMLKDQTSLPDDDVLALLAKPKAR
ncbi:MAG: LapA family protein [Paracoccaceae bacterium]